MDRLKVFDRALLGKQIGGNGLIVIIDVIYLIVGVAFGSMKMSNLLQFIIFTNMLCTCILYQNFVISKGDMRLELNTEKIIYYPTTRYHYLWNKYAKTLIFLVIQLSLTLACLGLGYYGNRSVMESSRIIAGLLAVYSSILLTSGIIILVMHSMPLGIYLSMLLYLPLYYLSSLAERLMIDNIDLIDGTAITVLIIAAIALLWILLLWIGGKVYERID